MLDLRIRKRFGAFVLDVTAQSEARVLGIAGSSGSGKTTLLNCIAGIVNPDQGRIIVGGCTLVDTAHAGRGLPVRQRGIGYIFQDGLLFPHLSVRANLVYGLNAHGVAADVDDVIGILELGSLIDRTTATLSGGEARRVAIGRALLSGPRLLLLDEPLTGLDRRLAGRTLHFLHRVLSAFDIQAVYVSHSISDVIFLCDEAWILDAGRLIAQGHPRDVALPMMKGVARMDRELQNLFVTERDTTSNRDLTAYRIGSQRLVVSAEGQPDSGPVMLSIPATDIMLARTRPERISARNVLSGRVTRLTPLGSHVVVFVDVGVEWMVMLTPAAVSELEIRPGVDLFAIVKASSISVLPA